jgi:hypothetical protein
VKKPALLAALLVVIAGLAVMSGLRRRAVSPPPFPCIATAKTGWLTAVTGQALLRLEWGDGSGRVGVSLVGDPPTWEPRDEASVRALALKVVEPISAPIRSNTTDEVSLFAGCDGVGAPWRGESRGTNSYVECLRPAGEGRIECLRRVSRSHDALTDEAPGAVADRINAVVTARGVRLVETSSRRYLRGPAPSSGWADQLLDRALPARAAPDEY